MRRLSLFSLSAGSPLNPLHLALRSATARQHRQLDAALAGGLGDRDSYLRYLLGMLPLVELLAPPPATVDARCAWSAWFDPQRRQWLHEDLGGLGLLPLAHGHAPLPAAWWMGASYVLEGSALGARTLLRDALRLRERDPGIPCAFLRHHARRSDRWPRFLDALHRLDGPLRDHAARGARHAFGLVADALTCHSEVPA